MTIKNNKYIYGWKPQARDNRDFIYKPLFSGIKIPVRIHLDDVPNFPLPYDQGQLGSCTANAISGAIQADQLKQKLPVIMPSRLFIYYNERKIEGTTSTDSGAIIRDGMTVLNTVGYCSEQTWPYIIDQFATEPTTTANIEAKSHAGVLYQSVAQDLNTLKATLASGLPIVFGISVYESFEGAGPAATGVIPLPAANEQLLGGHAILLVGYDDFYKAFKFRNSWGTSWGDKGYGYIPYSYVTDANLASDFWIVQHIV